MRVKVKHWRALTFEEKMRFLEAVASVRDWGKIKSKPAA